MQARFLLLIVLLVLNSLRTLAQAPSFQRLSDELVVSNVAVTVTYEDTKGFLWIGTWNGLYRFDGYTLKKYKLTISSPEEIKGEKIISLFEDRDGFLWIGTENTGLYKLDRQSEQITVYQTKGKNGLPNNKISTIFQDELGYIWVGTVSCVARLNKDGSFYCQTYPLPTTETNGFTRARDGAYWLATTNSLLRGVLSPQGRMSWTPISMEPPGLNYYLEKEAHNTIYGLKEDPKKDNVFWMGSKRGLKRLDYNKRQVEHIAASPQGLSNNIVTSIIFCKKAQLAGFFIGTDNGLNYYNPDKKTFVQYHHQPQLYNSLPADNVLHLSEDRVGQVWIGTTRGICRMVFSNTPFKRLHLPQDANINSLSAAKGRLWAGSYGQGLFELIPNGDEITYRHHSLGGASDFIYAIHADSKGKVWAATRGDGVYVLDASNPKQYQHFNTDNGLSHNYIMSVWQDDQGVTWIGSWAGGLNRHDPHTNTISSYRKLPNADIDLDKFPIVLIFDYRNKQGQQILCLGTRGGGIFEIALDKKGKPMKVLRRHLHHPSNSSTISSNFINCCRRDVFGRWWIGTEDGLNLWNQQAGTFKRFFQANGLPDDIIQSISEDDNGNLWVASTKGVSRFVLGKNMPDQCRIFDTKDGLPSNYFNANAACFIRDRYLFMGSNSGVLYFQPHKIRNNPIAPNIELVDFRLFNRTLNVGEAINNRVILPRNIGELDQLVLRHGDNQFSIEFAGLHFSEPEKNLYKYRLIGFNDNWITTSSKERLAQYSNLPHGRYTFEVTSANNDGLWAKKPARLQIRVLPPFWLSWWACLIYTLAIAAAIWLFRNAILIREQLRNQVRMETFKREKTEELGQMKMHFFTNISHELRTPLTLLLSPLEGLIKECDPKSSNYEIFNLMQRNAERLKNMINQLLEFRKIEEGLSRLEVEETELVHFFKNSAIAFRELFQHQNVHFSYLNMQPRIMAWIDRDLLEKVLFNLLSNAYKYSETGGNVELKLSSTDNTIVFSVADTGVGIAPNELPHIFEQFYRAPSANKGNRRQGTGIGLALVKSIVELHHGQITVESEVGKGSTFSVNIPTGNAHFQSDVIKAAPATEPLLLEASLDEVATIEAIEKADKPVLLVVEDNADIRRFVQHNLGATYTIIEAENGTEGWEKTQKYIPDIILSDVVMPEMDGFELCRKVKNKESTAHIPVILLSARSSQMYLTEGFDTGADDYMPKPFSVELLQVRIRNLLGNRERLQKHFDQHFTSKPSIELSPAELDITHLDKQFLDKCIALIEKNMDDPEYSVEQMSQELFVSRMQFYRKIKALTGDSPSGFIRTIRLKRAAQLLEKGYSVAEATYQVGFQDLRYFREHFKKQFGVNPSEFAQQSSSSAMGAKQD